MRTQNKLPITIKHSCDHYALHTVSVGNDREAAQIEAQLSRQPCKDCLNDEIVPVRWDFSKRLSAMESKGKA